MQKEYNIPCYIYLRIIFGKCMQARVKRKSVHRYTQGYCYTVSQDLMKICYMVGIAENKINQ